MTEKEFEQLKVGDKVWVIDGWWEQCVHDGKIRSINEERKTFEIKDNKRTFHNGEVFHSKIEAREALVKRTKDMYAYEVKLCGEWHDSVTKAEEELAKAKEEEEAYCWITDSGEVRKVRKSDYPCYIHYATEQEAYEALAKFYERKLFKTLEKCGYKFAVLWDNKWIVPMLVRAEEEEVYRVIYYPSQSYGCARKQDLFDTLDEAEAELERRKKND